MNQPDRSSGAWRSPFERLLRHESVRDIAEHADVRRMLALMSLFFLIVCAVGILRPIKNALALDGLGSTDFYKVYLVSAAVVLFVPLFNRLTHWLPWRVLFAGIALFFAINLVIFRVLYEPGSAALGMFFYGWYDLFAAALVTQFFMATQLFFNARSAKRVYPLVIAGGSIGATLGGAITGFFAESVGTANLLLVAAALITIFSVCIPWVLEGVELPPPKPSSELGAKRSEIVEIFSDRQVRLIAATVLMMILVKQLVDYQFNSISYQVFGSADAVSAFQGKFNAATQWLPLVALAGLRPALRKWGVGSAILLLPAAMLLTTAGFALTFGLWAAVAAKGAETSLRYSVERAGREILYVPIPDHIKLRAKAYIDVAVEKGIGKVSSALLIMLLLSFMGPRGVAYVTVALAAVWFAFAVSVRREYVRSLARSMAGRFASLRGVYASLLDASTLPVIRKSLLDPSPVRAAFALELLNQLPGEELRPILPDLMTLLKHERAEMRVASLEQLARATGSIDVDAVSALLSDSDEAVREAAVRALLATAGDGAPALLNRLLRHDDTTVRRAALSCTVGSTATPVLRAAGRTYLEARWDTVGGADADTRAELAIAAGGLQGDEDAGRFLDPFLLDEDPRVRAVALRSAGLLGRVDHAARMIDGLGEPATREAARLALADLGQAAVEPLAAALLDSTTPARVRRAIPRTLTAFPAQSTVDAMLRLVLADETDQLLDYRTLCALGRLRSENPGLVFDRTLVLDVASRECHAAAQYAAVRLGLTAVTDARSVQHLLHTALGEGYEQRREGVFRCLGLLYPPERVRQAHAAVASSVQSQRANALEWVEQIIGPERFQQLAPVLEPARIDKAARPETLCADGDAWIALLANAATQPVEMTMELIEKVFLLQQVDLLRGARGAHVALLASVAEEMSVPEDTVIVAAGSPPTALYVVTAGTVELSGVGGTMVIGPESAFGTWGLIDEQPSPIEARALEDVRLLRVTRDDFHDLLSDHSEVAIGMMQALVRRMRSVVA